MLEDYVDICISETYAGYRLGTHFNNVGWENVINKRATDEWWAKQLQEIIEAAKFQIAGLAHISKLDIMFRGIIAIGEGAWATSSGLGFEDAIRCDQYNNVLLELEEIDDLDDEPGDIQTNLGTQTKENKHVSPAVQDRKMKK
ncbi:hypothetical protein I3843_01G104800 [Carya illinoinensis]|nr:hypothetical protein I3843_01G104800 [Carya illinoinensis]